jgi:LysM repeat protein
MERLSTTLPTVLILILILAATMLSGCSAETTVEAASRKQDDSGSQDLSSEYTLALGTLHLQDTAQAVTDEQAVSLLPLWQVLQGNELQTAAERSAVVRQIEVSMTDAQGTAIAAMSLTQEDVRAWMESPRTDSAAPSARGLPGAVVELLAAQTGAFGAQAPEMEHTPLPEPTSAAVEPESTPLPDLEPTSATVEPESTPLPDPDTVPTGAAPEPVVHVVQAGDRLAAVARAYGVTAQAIATANGLTDLNTIHIGQALIIPDPTLVPASTGGTDSAIPVANEGTETGPVPAPSLKQMDDTQPGPPFTIEVSTNVATQDPLVEKSQNILIAGFVRNDGDQTYAVSTIHITFYDAEGFRGTFTPAIRDGKVVGGEWHWHGETEIDFTALLLAPGEVWPFSIEITAQDMASFLIHADATPTERVSTPVSLSEIEQIDDGTGYVRITGLATNTSPFEAKNVTVAGTLLNANDQVVSVGSTYVLQENIAPGTSVGFDLRIARASFASYQLFTQAERDWE